LKLKNQLNELKALDAKAEKQVNQMLEEEKGSDEQCNIY